MMSGPCACFTSMYVQNLPTAHAFVVAWRLVYTSCYPSLTFYGVSCFLIFLYGLLPLWGWALFDCGFFFLQPTLLRLSVVLHFLLHYSAIPIVMLFEPSLLGLFESATYSSLNDLVWSLGFLLHGLRAPASHLFPFGCPWPIYFPWASSTLSNFASSWTFTNSFGFPRPNYFILHPWGSWARHQPLTFFYCIILGLLWLILTLLHHILPMSLLIFSLRAP